MEAYLLSQEEKESLQKTLPSWFFNKESIKKTFVFKDFIDAFSFMMKVAFHAEKLNHHPNWNNNYNKVTITLSTHDLNGLSNIDVHLAQIVDKLRREDKSLT